MAGHKIADPRIYVGGLALHTIASAVRLNSEVEAVDVTCFGATTKKAAGGLYSVEAEIEGFTEYGATAIEAAAMARIGGSALPVAVVPDEQMIAGGIGYFLNGMVKGFGPASGQVGEYERFTLPITGAGGPLVRGVVLRAAGSTTTGATTAGQLVGATPATGRLWVAVFVISMTGSAVNVSIETDTAVGFPSPVTGITVPAITAAGIGGAAIASVAGALTDTYARAVIAVTGGNADLLVLSGVL